MKKVIYPGFAAYVPTGLLVGFIILLLSAVWMKGGFQTKAPQLLVTIIILYLMFCFGVSQRKVEITEEGIIVHHIFKKIHIFWSDISKSEITVWIDPKVPFQILVYGDDPNTPLVDIPVILYDKRDVIYLISIEHLKLSHSTSDESK